MKLKKLIYIFLFSALSLPVDSWADDTDLYLLPPPNQGRSKVLIIFDNSGSMDTIIEGAPGGYKPDKVYPPVGDSHSYSGRMIYFSIGTGMDESILPVPDSPSESRRFNELINGCSAATTALNTYGRFTGYIREYKKTGQDKGTWQQIKENSGAETNNPVDCWEDINAENTSNNSSITGYATGYPQNSVKSGGDYVPFGGTLANAQSMGFNSGELVTLYTDNYLRWYTLYQNGQLPPEDVSPTRLEMAQDAISGVISSIGSVDFGMAVFNLNYPSEGLRDGGRIIAGIKERTSAEKDSLISTLSNLSAQTNTPLCETMFEAYRYFSGGPITFGHSDEDYNSWGIHYTKNNPTYDTSIEKGGSYISPMDVCSDIAFVIYITDGAPTLDESANNYINALTAGGNADGEYDAYQYKDAIGDESARSSYLPALASYMYQNDLLPATEKFQRVITHTIGFSLGEESYAEPLLIETAARGNGEYFSADNTANLQAAISNIVDSITDEGRRFSAPGVALSNADPTRTLDSAYYALFSPSQGTRWAGNIKKFKVNSDGVLIDKNNTPAIGGDGGIIDTVCSVWSACSSIPDGNDVQEGGVARQIDPTNRSLLSNIGINGALDDLTLTKAVSYAGSDTNLANYLGILVSDTTTVQAELSNAFRWIQGWNVDRDENGALTSDDFNGIRGDIMGDPMHSQPLAIDYGGNGTNVRIFVGTNHGVLHAFKDQGTEVSESWAFMPYELLPNTTILRENSYASGHSVYGLDGSPVAYLERSTSGSITKAWLIIGMRRGGQSYYAFDVTSPDSPKLMWKVSSDSAGFTEMAQTWSTPVFAQLAGIDDPVVIFGGGYNLGYDSTTGANSDGRNVYLVNARTGALIHNFGFNGGTALSGIEHSIAGPIAILDSNGDGYTDRLYAADLGGNVWRMDMPSAATSTWSGFKFAQLGGMLANDRRFFYEPIVAQTYLTNTVEVTSTDASGVTTTSISYQDIRYDAVTLGSGNRAKPLAVGAQDMFFVLQDRNVVSKTFGENGDTVPSAITSANLYNVTSASPSSDAEKIEFGTKRGWYYDFTDAGEKSLSSSAIINGKVYFTSFVPAQDTAATDSSCFISSVGKLHVLDLHKGLRFVRHEDGTEELIETGSPSTTVCTDCIPSPPEFITPPPPSDPTDPTVPNPPQCDASLFMLMGSGECDAKGENCSGTVKLNACLNTNKVYYHINE
ncbi:PilC/PilY family type IV pilus protein [Shewanella sp. CG12_big_fil_rev_8_21_14_0_65_47_15]|uniref:pilus assembly protein n=1 Tax=Shewanella sp. CG12_big_fil_rev_8_21_14_0_65_47_15 TaxID=1975537 RepID=UPI000CC84AE5|nr:PilC/PilY family type IV pilus protein [Shewanella sp. CG12_big_fil_rev_8_21_14_0_65_47_15]PIW60985.1 MAG: type IV pilin biogenesis protein [Shewanella sp. CG12_big_fil_rev_8_21_14_0_65_47_15]